MAYGSFLKDFIYFFIHLFIYDTEPDISVHNISNLEILSRLLINKNGLSNTLHVNLIYCDQIKNLLKKYTALS